MIKLLITVFIWITLALARPNSSGGNKNEQQDLVIIMQCCRKTSFPLEGMMNIVQDPTNEKYSLCNTQESRNWVQCLLNEYEKEGSYRNQEGGLDENDAEVCALRHVKAEEIYKNCTLLNCVFEMQAKKREN